MNPNYNSLRNVHSDGSRISDERVIDYLRTQAAVRAWIEKSLEVKLGDDLLAALKNGIVLCYLMQKIDSALIPRIQENTSSVLRHKENLSFFIEACKEMGVSRYNLFQVSDLLYEKTNIVKVVECLATLASIAHQEKGFPHKCQKDPELKIVRPEGVALKSLKLMLVEMKEPPSKSVKGVKVSADLLRRKLAYLVGSGVDFSKYERGFAKFQALYRGFRARQAYKKMVRDMAYRDKVAKEILQTERDYVSSLGACIKVYLGAMQQELDKNRKYITKEDVKTIFSDIKIIHQFNAGLLQSIESRVSNWSPQQKLGDIFLEIVGFLRVYTNYVQNFDKSVATLEQLSKKEKFINLMKECKNVPEAKSLDLPAFLIMPVQRIPRYNLLLVELVKRTWNGHADYENLHKAAEQVKEVALSINEKKRNAEELALAFEMHSLIGGKHTIDTTPQRKFIKEGVLLEAKTGKEVAVMLFSDIVVYGKPSATVKSKSKSKLKYSGSFPVSQDGITEHADVKKHKNCFRLGDLVLSAKTPAEVAEWVSTASKVQSPTKEEEGSSAGSCAEKLAADKEEPTEGTTAEEELRLRKSLKSASTPTIKSPGMDKRGDLVHTKNILIQQIQDLNSQMKKPENKSNEKVFLTLREKLEKELEGVIRMIGEIDNNCNNSPKIILLNGEIGATVARRKFTVPPLSSSADGNIKAK